MNIIELAKQSGMVYREFEDEFANGNTDGVDLKTLQAFAALVAAHEREECAKVCDNYDIKYDVNTCDTAEGIALEIRARGTT
jgi:hypothetical protein